MAQQPSGLRLSSFTSAEVAAKAGAVVLVPVGAVEQHGPHLALGTDWRIADEVAVRAAAAVGDVLVADPLPYGCSAHHLDFAGTVSLSVAAFQAAIVDVARSLSRARLLPVFVNGHGGNRAPLGAALQSLLEGGTAAWALSWFELVREPATAELGAPTMGHACALETSLMLHLDGGWVRPGLVPVGGPSTRYPDPSLFSGDPIVRHRPFEEFVANGAVGVVGDPSLATPQIGERMLDHAVRALADVIHRIRAAELEPHTSQEEEA